MSVDKNWYDRCEEIVGSILSDIGISKKKIKQYFSDDKQEYWVICFTHRSYSDMNYERIEFLGDELLDFSFSLYLYRKYKGKFTESQMSELKRFYMSKHKQPDLTRGLKINKLLIYNKDIPKNAGINNTDKVCSDLYESFFFTIYEVSEQVEKNSGIDVVSRIIEHIFENVEIEEKEGEGHPKNRVNQTFQTILSSSKDVNKTIQNINGTFIVSIYTPDKARQVLVEYNILLPEILGVGKDKNKSKASTDAYNNALQTLIDRGLDKNKLLFTKSLILLNKIKNKKLVNEFRTKLNENDYSYFQIEDQKIENVQDKDPIIMYYLYGVKDRETRDRLAFKYFPQSEQNENILESLIIKYMKK